MIPVVFNWAVECGQTPQALGMCNSAAHHLAACCTVVVVSLWGRGVMHISVRA